MKTLAEILDELERTCPLPVSPAITVPRGPADEARDERERRIEGRITSRPALQNFHDE